jgi:ParB/RepB/Spo0J family partition protein
MEKSERSRLGRGLGAMLSQSRKASEERIEEEASENSASALPQNVSAADPERQIVDIELSKLEPSVYQPRRDFNDEGIAELAQSIKANGLLDPLIVKKNDSGDKYEIICGERRFRACKILGMDKVQCVVRDLVPEKSYAVALIENIQREDLNPVEQAYALDQMLSQCHMTQEELASSIGKSRSTVTNLLRINALADDVKQLLAERSIDLGHAKVVMSLERDLQSKAAAYIAKKGLSVRQAEEFVKKLASGKNSGSKDKKLPDELEIVQQELSNRFEGIKCSLVGSNTKRGKFVLAYKSEEEFKRIRELLGLPASDA